MGHCSPQDPLLLALTASGPVSRIRPHCTVGGELQGVFWEKTSYPPKEVQALAISYEQELIRTAVPADFKGNSLRIENKIS